MLIPYHWEIDGWHMQIKGCVDNPHLVYSIVLFLFSSAAKALVTNIPITVRQSLGVTIGQCV